MAADAIVVVNLQKSILFVNQSAEVAFGYAAGEVRSKPLRLLIRRGMVRLDRRRSTELDALGENAWRASEPLHVVGRRKDGSLFPALVSLSRIELESGSVLSLTLQDARSRAFTEERLRSALHEKEVLLEEVHHRVKNNLQVITSLLGLQARSIKDPATRTKFDESRYRIQAMAILHEILDESSSLAEIAFADYIRRLVAHVFRSYGAIGRIRTRLLLDRISCHREVALPCGLIATEILSNALKYAFPGGKTGELEIELRRESSGRVQLVIVDNGIGLPPGLDWETSRTLGLRLVRTLARQIEANVQIRSDNGTAFSIAFRDGLRMGVK